MKVEKRRREIASLLMAAKAPVSGGALSARVGVSRQIVVQDIAALKEAGYEILATHKGYMIQSAPIVERVFEVYHDSNRTADELSLIVEAGGIVADVYVWHKVYGRIGAPLNIFSAEDVLAFTESLKNGRSTELMHVTGGYHYHTVRADSEAVLDHIQQLLTKGGYIVPKP